MVMTVATEHSSAHTASQRELGPWVPCGAEIPSLRVETLREEKVVQRHGVRLSQIVARIQVTRTILELSNVRCHLCSNLHFPTCLGMVGRLALTVLVKEQVFAQK